MCFIISAICIFLSVKNIYEGKKSAETYSNLAEYVQTDNTDSEVDKETNEREESIQSEQTESTSFTGLIEGEETKIPDELTTNKVDFDKLQEINPELYAWIYIPDTQINYPVAQHDSDQLFYLHHDFYGNEQSAGCIFSQIPTAKDFSDQITVLYGHNMKNGSMFRGLHAYMTDEMNDNLYVYISTPDKQFIYRIYSVYYGDNKNITYTNDFSSKETIEKYIETTKNPRSMNRKIYNTEDVNKDSNILILSTCVANQPENRLLVNCVLVEKTEN